MSKLRCENLTVKYFGYDAAISSVTTDFSDGINVVFAAEKGGKTTFLKALSGILSYEGSIFLDDVDLKEIPLKERDFQMVFDDYALFHRRSVRYNLEYPLKIRKVSKEERRKRVEEVAELFDLDIMLDAPVYRLNEWLKVALVLCRAYLRKPKVLLIDNIFSKLSLTERRAAFLRFMPLLSDGIVIYATDHKEEAEALSEKIKFLSCGYLLQEGKASDFVIRPNAASVFSAFATYPSLLHCRVKQGGIEICENFFPLDIALKSDVYYEKDVLVGVLPDDVIENERGFSATVVCRYFDKDAFVYYVDCDCGSVFFRSSKEIRSGDAVLLSIKKVTGIFDAMNERSVLEETK